MNALLVDELHDLQDNFDEEIRITKKRFREEDLPDIIDYIKTHAKSILGPNKKHQATAVEAVKEDFDHIQTIQELFSVLQKKYISWFNYELIVKLVQVFLSNNRSLKRRWSSYKDKLKDYFINSGGLLKDVDAVEFGITDAPPGTRVMIARVDRDDYKLDDLFFFRRAIPKELDVSEVKIYFRKVRFGSLHLEHLIPDYLYSLLFPLTPKLQQQLASIGITELTCGEYVYHLKEVI